MNLKELLREALEGGTRHRNALERERRILAAGIQASRERFLEAHIRIPRPVRLDASDFRSIRGRTTPLLLEPAIMDLALPCKASEAILGLKQARPHRDPIARIFARSSFEEGNRRYRTDSTPAGPAIRGENAPTVRAFAALAHELGHCLAEEGIIEGGYSETPAHLLEEELTASYLRGAGIETGEWTAYQRKVDAANFHFFELECVEYAGTPPPAAIVDPALLFLRESIFRMPGYQVQYAEASLARIGRAS